MTDQEIIECAKQTLFFTYEAIRKQSLNLPKYFPEVVKLLAQNRGKIFFCGVGKSGQIARKLSSTFSSIGSPSIFLHPTEANHGDLGSIKKKDMVFFISKSGNSRELNDISRFAKKEKIKTISICSESNSILAKNSDYALIILETREACPFNLVPTASTSLSLAIGHALAIAVMKEKKFSIEDFGKYHPSGSLGTKFVKVERLMRKKKDMPLVLETDDMKKAVLEITRKGLGVTGVLNNKKELVGIITDGDLRRAFNANLKNPAKKTMTKNPLTIDKEEFISEALSVMNKNRITSLFIKKKNTNQPQGIIHLHDCIRALKNVN